MIRPSVTVVVPAYNAGATLPACLEAIGRLAYPIAEVIVFSDGSTDRTDRIADDAGARVIRNAGRPLGPAKGRNEAANAAGSELLLFVDADVVVAPDCLELLVADLMANQASAAFGSYDDGPHSQRVTSLYANLRHHFVHQHSSRDATTFWSGLGLMRRDVFVALGGYDAEAFAHPSIEDIELGVRLIAAGHRIRLVPEAQATHWKDWSLWRVWHTDVVRRAYPWSRLIATSQTNGADLNLSTVERGKAVLAVLTLVLIVMGMFEPLLLAGAALTLLAYSVSNARFFGFLARKLSPPRVLGAIAMHWCYHLYSSATFALVLVQSRLEALVRYRPG